MTQLERARRGVVTDEMRRVALREGTSPEFIRSEIARGALVIPANVRHLAGSGGEEPAGGRHAYPADRAGHPGARDGALWVNQTTLQRAAVLDDPDWLRG